MPIYTENLTENFAETSDFAGSDCILITGAGMDALEDAPVVPDVEVVADAEEAEAFKPNTAEKADWVLGKIADSRARAARIRENAEAMAREQERQAEGLEWRYGAALEAFARQQIAGSKRKSLRLYHGVLGYRTRPASVSLTDPAAALAWARESLPAAVVETLDKKALTAVLLDTGEAVPFAAFQPAEDVFYIK